MEEFKKGSLKNKERKRFKLGKLEPQKGKIVMIEATFLSLLEKDMPNRGFFKDKKN